MFNKEYYEGRKNKLNNKLQVLRFNFINDNTALLVRYQNNQKLEKEILELKQQINQSQNNQLVYPLDDNSKEVINKTIDEFLKDKIFDLVWKKLTHWFLAFESLDGYTQSNSAGSSIGIDGNDVVLLTGGTSGNFSTLTTDPFWQGLLTFSQQSNMRSSFILADGGGGSISNFTFYMTIGSATAGNKYYGFKRANGNLYGGTSDGTTENSVLLQTIAFSQTYNIEARYTPSEKVIFFVNAVEKGVSGSNIPTTNSTTASAQFMYIKITTNENVSKTLQVSYFEYLQFRNIL